MIARYRIERTLAEGGMASVYLAHDEELDRRVAVKVIRPARAADEGFRERFLREARLAARLSHPNVVHVFDAGRDEAGNPYLVMEYVEGETLAALLAREGRLPVERALELAVQACAGLAHAHAAGLVHRDVKPHNLLVRRDGTLKVADFGIARAAEQSRLTQTGTILGTAAYLAPEQAEGAEATPAADVYALGAVLYELLSGRTPHVFDSLVELVRKQREEPIAPLRELAPEVPAPVEDVVMHCLARDPAYRPPDAGALRDELAAAAAGTITLRLPAPVAPVPGRKSPWLWAGLAGGLALVGLGAGLAAALSGGGGTRKPPPAAAARVTPVPHGATPAAEARNLAAWLRSHSR